MRNIKSSIGVNLLRWLFLLVVMFSTHVFGGDVVGKLTVGYQGWFSCAGDGSPNNSWNHWAQYGVQPSPGNQKFELYPDCREYTTTYQTGYANLGNGLPAKLFASHDNQVVGKHFQWMKDYGIDTAALQRFDGGAQNNGMVYKVKGAAYNNGRKFYIMYDIGGWANNFPQSIKDDWAWLKNVVTTTSAYAKEDGKPVVCLWGVGVPGRPGNNAQWTDLVNWLKGQGCYVIIGTPRQWRTEYLGVYGVANMISPWSVACMNTDASVDAYAQVMLADKNLCYGRGQAYQPVVYPGFAWSNWVPGAARNAIPRRHGDLMWRMFAQVRSKGINCVYVAMFDEYDEGTAIAKAAENSSMIPTDQYFLTLDADGVACSSDFYLRLTGDGAKMIKGLIGLTWAHPTPHNVSPSVPIGKTIALKANANAKYVCADGGLDAVNWRLVANRTSVGAWEKFAVVDAGGGLIGLKASANGKYVCADANLGTERPLAANRTGIGAWEKYTWISNSDGTISLKANTNGKYVCADMGISASVPLVANRTGIGAWEKFTVEIK